MIYNDAYQLGLKPELFKSWSPKLFHRIWFGGEMPAKYVEYGKQWRAMHPEWVMLEWSEQDVSDACPTLGSFVKEALKKRDLREASDIMRLELIYRFGGVYLDTDFQPLQPLDETLEGWDCFLTAMTRVGLANGLFGASVYHPFSKHLMSAIPAAVSEYSTKDIVVRTGPSFFTREYKTWVAAGKTAPKVFEPSLFYPYTYKQMSLKDGPFPGAVAVHHWGQQIKRDEKRAKRATRAD